MDADWSVEIGAGLPWIEVPWEGWVDLRDPLTAEAELHALPEVAAYPEFAELLLEANASPPGTVLTSKCDVFPVDADSAAHALMDADASEPDGDQEGAQALVHGLGSYLDICVTAATLFSDFAWHESLARRVASQLLAPLLMPRTSVELVIRQASLFTRSGFGLTLYATGFGPDPAKARQAWSQALQVAASVTIKEIQTQASALLRQPVEGA